MAAPASTPPDRMAASAHSTARALAHRGKYARGLIGTTGTDPYGSRSNTQWAVQVGRPRTLRTGRRDGQRLQRRGAGLRGTTTLDSFLPKMHLFIRRASGTLLRFIVVVHAAIASVLLLISCMRKSLEYFI